jgi:ubiquinone/menaquinone biosynthesis C-methylase UbiE
VCPDAELKAKKTTYHILEYHRRWRNDELVKYMPYRAGLRTLGCRCGKGVLLDQLEGRVGEAWGVDCSTAALDGALAPGQVSVAQMARLPCSAETVDVVFGHEVLYRAQTPARVLAEMARVLCTGGRLILWEPRRLLRRAPVADIAQQMHDAGLVLAVTEYLDFVAYPVAAALNVVPILSRSHLAQSLDKALFALDNLLARVSGLQAYTWHLILVAEKRATPSSPSSWICGGRD